MKQIPFILILAFFIFTPGSARALDIEGSIGGMGLLKPIYEGSKEYEIDPLPWIDIFIGKRVFLDSENGLGIYLLKHKVLEFGGSLGYYESREESDSDKLQGFDDIGDGIDGRMFAKLKLYNYSLSVLVRNDLSSNHNGTLLNFGAGYSFQPFRSSNWSFRAFTTFADDNYMQTYFSVSQDQLNGSLIPLSIRAPFTATGGLKDIGLNSNFSIQLDRRWKAKWVFGYKRLTRAAAYSPLTRGLGSEDQYHFGVGLAYDFSGGALRF
jgi:outer membrane scaffolding protein for murein synthesis (MipA/OmpV family)